MHAYPHVEFFDKYNDEIKEVNARACALRNEHPVTVNPGTLLIDDTVVTDAVGTFTVPSEYWAIVTGTEPVADMFAAMKERILAGGFEQAAKLCSLPTNNILPLTTNPPPKGGEYGSFIKPDKKLIRKLRT